MGLGNPPAVQELTCGLVRFGYRPGQKPNPLCLGGVVTWTGYKLADFGPGCTHTAGPFYGSRNVPSNWVSEITTYHDMLNTHIVQFLPLFHILLLDLQSDQYSLNRCEMIPYFQRNSRVFDSDSTNISPIPNLTAGGERAVKTAQCTYWLCHGTIRTQFLNWRQNCELEMPGFWW